MITLMKSRRRIAFPKGQVHADCDCVQLQQGFVIDEMGFRVSLHGSNPEPLMSALGQKQTLQGVSLMSALPPKRTLIERVGMSALCRRMHLSAEWSFD
jgi:hypothetical protein